MNSVARIRLGLAGKLAICVITSTAAFFTLFGFLNLRMARSNSEALVTVSADRLANIMLRSTRYGMLNNDQKALANIIQELGSAPGIQRVRILNQDGRVAYSTDPREVNTIADAPRGAERVRIFRDPQGQRVLAVIRPIPNSPTCSDAVCH